MRAGAAGRRARPSNPMSEVSGPDARGWEAVEHADERLRDRAAARQRAEERRRRRWGWLAWILRIALPLLGAAAVLATLQAAGGDLRGWQTGAAAAVPAAELLVPAAGVALTGRGDGAIEALLWALAALAAEVALVFGAGFVLLGLGPG
jgi:hypothetical protein